MPTKTPDTPGLDDDLDETLDETLDEEGELSRFDAPEAISLEIPPPEEEPEKPRHEALDVAECLSSLGQFHRNLLAARISIPKGLQSRNQALMLGKIEAILEKSRLLMREIPDAKSEEQQFALAQRIAHFTEEMVESLTTFFEGIHLYYHKKAGQLVWPKYVCCMYVHIFRGFKYQLHPLVKGIIENNSFPEKIVSIEGMADFEKNIRNLYGLSPEKDDAEERLHHVEDTPLHTFRSVGTRSVLPNYYFKEACELADAKMGAYKGDDWQEPKAPTKNVPDSWVRDKGGAFAVPNMKEFDGREAGAMMLDDDEAPTEDVPGEMEIGDALTSMEESGEPPVIYETSGPLSMAPAGEAIETRSESIDEDSFDDEPEGEIPSEEIFENGRIPDEALDAAMEEVNGRSHPPVIRQRKKTRKRWLALAAAAGLALMAAGGGMWVMDKVSSGPTGGAGDNANTPALSAMPSSPDAPDQSGRTFSGPQIEPAPPDEVGGLDDAGPDPELEPDNVEPDDAGGPELDLDPGPGNWPWNILEQRVADAYGGEPGSLTPEGRLALAKMNVELLSQAITQTSLMKDANLPYSNPNYLTQVAPMLEAWGGWGPELEKIEEGTTLMQLLNKMSPERADHLRASLASTRIDGKTLTQMMELARDLPFPDGVPETPEAPEAPEAPSEPELTPDVVPELIPEVTPDNQAPSQDTASPDGYGDAGGGADALSPYEAPDAPVHLFEPRNTRTEPWRDPFDPNPEKRDPFKPWEGLALPEDPTDAPAPLGLLREKHPDATKEEVEQILADFTAGTVTPKKRVQPEPVREQKTTQIGPQVPAPRFEQVRQKHPVETVAETVVEKVSGLFGWVGRRLERAFA